MMGAAATSQVDEYRVLVPLGRPEDDVFLAHDRKLDRAVVLHLLPAAPAARGPLLDCARALARVTHPSLCPVYRIREGGHAPCVVQSFERGDRLATLAALPADRVIALGCALAGALATLHAARVAHGDVRADRVVVSSSGVPRLIGLRAARAGASPEAMSADVRGLCEALLAIAGGELDASLRRFLATDGQMLSAEAFRHALERRAAPEGEADAGFAVDGSGDRLPNPYRGLRPFEAEHAGLFFGRQGEIDAALARLRSEPWLLVAAPSGAGKSSFLRAGILSAVAAGALAERSRWEVVTLVPGTRPLAALAKRLAPLVDRDPGALDADLRVDPALAGRLARARRPSEGGLLLLIDQLEETVTLTSAAERDAFLAVLGGFEALAPGVRVLFTLRSDFLDHFATVERGPLARSFLRATFVLPPLGAEALRLAIVGPAGARGFTLETEAMVDQLVGEGQIHPGGDALPLLSFLLAELWEERDHARRVLPAAALARLGDAAAALARHGDTVLSALSAEERRAARRILLALVTPEETRARRTREELVMADGREGGRAAERALEALIRGRIVMAGDAYEIAHEALVRAWPRLRAWLDDASDERGAARRLVAAAAEWERLGRDPALLWGARQARDLERIGSLARVSAGARAFAEASRAAVRRRDVRRWAVRLGAPLAALFLSAGTLGFFRWREQRQTHAFVAAHIAEADVASREELALEDELATARAAAFASFDADDRPGGEARWKDAILLARRAADALDRATNLLGEALARDPLDPAARTRARDLTERRLLAAERDHDADLARDLGARLAGLDDDGSRRAFLTAPAHLRVTADPSAASVALHAVHLDAGLRRVEGEGRPIAPGASVDLTPGSYVIVASAPERYSTRLPVLLHRGEAMDVEVPLPASADVPPGLVFVPAGVSLIGAADIEGLRAIFIAEPEHPVHVDAFLIGEREVTMGEYLEFLADLPIAERSARRPHGISHDFGYDSEGVPFLTLGKVTVRRGEPWCRPGRRARRCQDWLRFPVAAVSPDDAQAYVEWLARARVPGARRCTEREWERAARGADGRLFAHGDALQPGDANLEETYESDSEMMGVDEVGAFPADRSPFGVLDLNANVREWVMPTRGRMARGGAWSDGAPVARSAARYSDLDARSGNVGFRVCASLSRRRAGP